MPEIRPSGIEEHEEEEEEAAFSLRPPGLCSRGPAVLVKVEPAGQSIMAEGAMVAERPKQVMERAKVEILS